ncbi:hypothetical protein KFQ04_22125 [Pseudomonas synxantha]|nr:hypothetical protein KFQ04_22125 [Pseudomonas synxantha]
MEVTKQTFDHAACYLLGHKFDHLREAESFSRGDICKVIALDEFVDTLFGSDPKEKLRPWILCALLLCGCGTA